MSDFTERMYQKFLPTTEAYIKSVQASHQDPMKRIALINKEIATLTNPRNLRAASKQSVGAWTQLLSKYLDLQKASEAGRKKAIKKLTDNLDNYNNTYNDLESKIKSEESLKNIQAYVGKLKTARNAEVFLRTKLPALVNEKAAGKDQTKAQLFALREIRRQLLTPEKEGATASYPLAEKAIGKIFLEKLAVASIDPRFSTPSGKKKLQQILKAHNDGTKLFNLESYFDYQYPDLRGAEDSILANPRKNIPINAKNELLNDVDLDAYVGYEDDIAWVKGKINGTDKPVALPAVEDSYAAKKAYVEALVPRGLTLDEQSDRIIIDDAATPQNQKIATEFLSKNIGKAAKYSDFIESEPIKQLASGITSGTSAQKRMLERAAELEDQKISLMQLAMVDKDLTPAEKSVLRNPLFTRTGFRRTAPYRLLKRTQGLDASLDALDARLQEFDQPEEPADVPVAQDVTPGEKTGVPVIPATVKIFQDAVTRYDVSGNIGPLLAVRDAFFAMPVAVRDNFPKIFKEQLANLSNDKFPLVDPSDPRKIILLDETTSKGGFDRKARLDALMASLDQTELTTETVSDFIASLGEDDSQDNVNRLKSMVNLMGVYMTTSTETFDAPASALGKGADRFEDPGGTLGKALADAETPEEIAAIKERAVRFAQRSSIGYDPNVYGTYPGIESVDPDEVAPDEPPVEQPEAPPPSPARPSRMDRRIARRAKQIDADRLAKELAAAEQQREELELRNLDRDLERDDEEDAVAEQEFLDQIEIPTLKEGTLETDPDRFADQQKMIGNVDIKLKEFQQRRRDEAAKKATDQAVADAASDRIQDPLAMDVGPVRSIFDTPPAPTKPSGKAREEKDPFNMGLPVPPPKSEEESTNDLLIAGMPRSYEVPHFESPRGTTLVDQRSTADRLEVLNLTLKDLNVSPEFANLASEVEKELSSAEGFQMRNLIQTGRFAPGTQRGDYYGTDRFGEPYPFPTGKGSSSFSEKLTTYGNLKRKIIDEIRNDPDYNLVKSGSRDATEDQINKVKQYDYTLESITDLEKAAQNAQLLSRDGKGSEPRVGDRGTEDVIESLPDTSKSVNDVLISETRTPSPTKQAGP